MSFRGVTLPPVYSDNYEHSTIGLNEFNDMTANFVGVDGTISKADITAAAAKAGISLAAPGWGTFIGAGVGYLYDNRKQIMAAIGPWKENRPGQRDKAGWGLPLDSFNGFEFTTKEGSWKMMPQWEIQKDANGAVTGVGYPVYFNGAKIDNTKYMWVADDGKVYGQDAVAPWETTQTAGKIKVYTTALFPMHYVDFVGPGTEPQPLAFTIANNKIDNPAPKDNSGSGSGSGLPDGLNNVPTWVWWVVGAIILLMIVKSLLK